MIADILKILVLLLPFVLAAIQRWQKKQKESGDDRDMGEAVADRDSRRVRDLLRDVLPD